MEILFDNFNQAADRWLELWHLSSNGCLLLSEGLKEIPANTPEEWEKIAASYIKTCHCGRCNYNTLSRIHKLVTKRVVENISPKETKEGLKWYIKEKKTKKRKSKAHLYASV